MKMDKQMEMRTEWDQIAEINAYFGVDAVSEFENTNGLDESLFWFRGRDFAGDFITRLKLGDTSNWTMVEVGCGLGRMTHYFAEKFHRVYAVDISPAMLAKAKNKWGHLSNVEFILGSGSDLEPIKTSSVDFVFSFIVLQHVLDSSIVLNYIRETSRVLSPHGLSFLQFKTYTPEIVPAPDFFTRIKLLIPERLKKKVKRALGIAQPQASQPLPIAPPQNLEERYLQEFKVWRGCRVSTLDVIKTARECGLRIEDVSGENTKYTYYTFRKELVR